MNDKTLAQLYAEHQGRVSDKWSLYLAEYDRIFSAYRKKNIRLLEIGVQNGGSLDIWSKYFPNGLKFVGCDINPDCSHLEYEDPRIAVVVGDACTDDAQKKILQHSAEFDIVVDDGSHFSSDIIKSFARYFANLVEGGLFIAEDLHCSYWQEYEGGLFDPFSSIAFFKLLADIINYEHWGVEKKRAELFRGFFAKYGFELDENLLGQVHSVEFINSTCVVRKLAEKDNLLGERVVAGILEEIVPGLRDLPNIEPSQAHNIWSSRDIGPPEELSIRLKDLADRDSQIGELKQAVVNRDSQIGELKQAVVARDSQIGELKQAVVDRDRQIGELNQAVVERDSQVGELKQSVVDRDSQIGELKQAVVDRDRQIGELNQAVVERDSQVGELKQSVVDRDSQIGELKQAVVARDSQIGELTQAVVDRDSQVGDLKQAVVDRDRQIGELKQAVVERDSQIGELKQAVIDRDNQISSILHSKSWKITRPARAIRKIFK